MIYSRAFHPAFSGVRARANRVPLPPKIAAGTATFDYIVIGAGSAGCALVARLMSGSPTATVLLLEAGPTNEVPQIQDFTQAMTLRGTIYDWNDHSQPQTCMSGQSVPYDAGHVNGGCSSINGMVWVRGNPADYDAWAQAGCAGWGYDDVLGVFIRQEKYGGVEGSPARGTSGPVYTTNTLSVNPVSIAFIESMVEMGYPMNPDYNSGTQQGVTLTQLNVAPSDGPFYGIRQDAYNAFVAPYSGDPRLTVVNGAWVQRIVCDDQRNAFQVWFDYNGVSLPVNAAAEIILSAGALRTPQILMLSGIGDPNVLSSLGIPVVLAQPAVGQNLQDQLIPFVVWGMSQPDPGHFTVMDNNVFVGSTMSGAPIYEMQTFYMTNAPGFPPTSFGLGAIVLHPETRGQVTLASANYQDAPLIQPNLLCNPNDVSQSLAGLKLARQMASQFAATSNWLASEVAPGPNVNTDAELIAYMNHTAVPDFHYVGTCKMGADSASVVDPTCRVRGINNLRVADASIMPFVTSGNTNAPSMMIGGRCGDFIVAGTPSPG
ncbi:MAG: GMC oxidoreductase [Polyangiaceae bacterium]